MSKEAGKGDKPRPFHVDRKTYEKNWNTIFKKKEDTNVPSREKGKD